MYDEVFRELTYKNGSDEEVNEDQKDAYSRLLKILSKYPE